MAYEKRLCILKQIKKGFTADGDTLSGAVHAERLGENAVFTPRLLALAPVTDGRYAFAFYLGGKIFILDAEGNGALSIPNAPSLKDGFAALLCFVRVDAEPVAFGSCGTAPTDYRILLSAFQRVEQKRKKSVSGEIAPAAKRKAVPVPMPPNQVPGVPSPQTPTAPGVPVSGYSDDQIAEENYFLKEAEREGKFHENETTAPRRQTAAKKGEGGGDAPTHAGDGSFVPFGFEGGATYYEENRERIEELFAKYPSDDRLVGVFHGSRWVNVGGALFGILYENGTPSFLCVAKEKDGDPPKEMEGKCTFVPASCYDDEKGFYVVFQSARTGALIKCTAS